MPRLSRSRYAMLAAVFFAIAFGLGYPTLNRYRPSELPGLRDTYRYAAMADGHLETARAPWRYRLLVPYLARPVVRAATGRIGTWDPVFFGLLVVNSLFVALSALLVVHVGERALGDTATAVVGALLYLLDFSVANSHLAGRVDSAEGFFLLAVVGAVLTGRWHLLPAAGLAGALAKETFVPLAAAMALGWWAWEWRHGRGRTVALLWIGAMLAAAAAGLALVRLAADGTVVAAVLPREVVRPGFLRNVAGEIANHGMLLTFAWLLPLALPRLRRLPAAWVFAVAAASVLALALGGLVGAADNASRPLFNVAGPLLSLAAADFLLRGPARGAPDPVAPAPPRDAAAIQTGA